MTTKLHDHQYYITEMINPVKIRQEAVKRQQKGQRSVVHLHSAKERCDGHDHEFYEIHE